MKQIEKTLKILRRSPYQALAAGLAMTLTFFVGSIFVILVVGGQIVLNYIEQRPQVIAFFKEEAGEDKIRQIQSDIEATGLVKEVKYVTKEEALAIYRERNRDEPLLLESVSADFLPASIDISVNRVSDIDEITKMVKDRPEVERVVTPEDLVRELVKWTQTLRAGGIIFVSLLSAVSFLIIVMVIGMRIAIRREEISIINLVGATKFYIAKPFLIEGAFYGVIGSTISVFLVYIILLFYSPQIQSFLGPIQIFPIHPLFFIYLWLGETLVAVSLGGVGAAISLYRYLKVS